MPISQHHSTSSQALIIGGSIAGLLAARALCDVYDRVILVERDRLPNEPKLRPSVPQASHVHGLLSQGYRLLQQFFPGIEEELAAVGAVPIDPTHECPTFGYWGWTISADSDLQVYACSRLYLEWLLYRRLARFENFSVLEGTQAVKLLANEAKTRITGLEIRDRESDRRQTLTADLIVEASGRNSQLPQWLADFGYAAPEITTVNSFLGYASRWYQCPPGFEADWKAILMTAKVPDCKRGGVLYPVEGDRWILTLSGIAKDYPPSDEAGFLEFARSLRHPLIYEVIQQAEPISPIYSYRRTENQRRHYEKLKRMPEGIVAVGDAVCAFNPAYGQGMTTAAIEAQLLSQWLHQRSRRSVQFQKMLARAIATPWLMATSEDFRWDTTEGGQPSAFDRLMYRYMDGVMMLNTRDRNTLRTFVEVAHLVKPPTALFHPKIAIPVIQQLLKGDIPIVTDPNPTFTVKKPHSVL
jgi:2-polyprenyl-6-methoxyphenol hydroxylase-like FAD-dependent oxidoreductase